MTAPEFSFLQSVTRDKTPLVQFTVVVTRDWTLGQNGTVGARNQELPRYLSYLISIFRCLFGGQAPALKLGSTETQLWRWEEKNWVFILFIFLRLHTKNHWKPEGIMQKTENWHFGDHQICGGSVSELHRDMPGSCPSSPFHHHVTCGNNKRVVCDSKLHILPRNDILKKFLI
jgi:hypothetical protein